MNKYNFKKPLVSVVIPTYNQANYLNVAIQSVVDQTYENLEIIIVNNYSEDNTIEVVKNFSDSRINIVNFKNNGNIAASRNRGIELANGELIAFLDSDDYWYSNKLEKCIDELNDNISVICHGELWCKNGRRFKNVTYGPANCSMYMSLLLTGNCISTSASIVRKTILDDIGGFCEDPAIVTAEDYDLWLRIARRGGEVKFIDSMLGVYRLHENNASGRVLRNLSATMKVLDKHISLLAPLSFILMLKIYIRKARLYLGAIRRRGCKRNCVTG